MQIMTSDEIKSALKQRLARHADISAAENLRLTTDETKQRLAETGDLTNRKVLAELAEVHSLAGALSFCKTAREEALANFDREFLGKCNEFVMTINARLRKLADVARSKARAALEAHLSDEVALERSIEDSSIVRSVNNVGSYSLTENPLGGVVQFAERLLAAWAEADRVEKEIS